MSQYDKILSKILSGLLDKDIRFLELCNLLKYLGFEERIKGSHHIFYKDGIKEILNLQPDESRAKPYQVKQVRNIILKEVLENVTQVIEEWLVTAREIGREIPEPKGRLVYA